MYIDGNIVNLLGSFLFEHGYIKFNRFLWGKNIKTELVTGSVILVDLLKSEMTMMKVKDSFLWIKTRPKVELNRIKYNTLSEFKRNVIQNEMAQMDFEKKQNDWDSRK